MNGLIPAVIQDMETLQVLMVGMMNEAALSVTRSSGKVTFYSRTRQSLWQKGESSGHYLLVKEILIDCDQDTILIFVHPQGPTCHTGAQSCFGDRNSPLSAFGRLNSIIEMRAESFDKGSYTTSLLESGLKRIAQKVGEEGVELALAAVTEDNGAFLGEMTDLLYHMFVLLKARGLALSDLSDVIEQRL
ncbi:MAG: bifunctional phosphoribosyl-AMP cyclohydrolase/phosphoribosyl-ATP diphosphatase HisIE [Gammaproteobacteria bacterium]